MKKNVASQVIGAQMVSATDGSAFTGSVTCYVLGNGGTQAAGSVGSGACTHEGNGFHTYAPAQAETNYDHIAFTFTGTGAVPASVQVYPNFPQTADHTANIADILTDTGTTLQAELDGIQADTEDIQSRLPAALVSGRIDASVGAMAVNVMTAAAAASDLTTELQSGLATASALSTMQGNVTDILADTADMQPKIGTPVTSLAADIAAIEAQTDDIGTAGAGLTAVPWNAAWDAEVQSEVADALAAYGAATATDVTTAAANVSVDEIQVSALADLFNTNSGTTYGAAVSGSVVKEIADNAGGAALTVQDIVDGVWDEPMADHLDSGTTGASLNGAGSAGDPWSTTLPGAYGAGTAGKIVGDNLNATVSSRATQTSVDDLPTNSELATALDPLPTAAENATAVWAAGTRSLTVLDEDSTTLDLDATIRAAVGLGSANLDTQLGDLPTNAELATSQAAADDATLAAIAALSIPTATQNADALLNRDMSAVSDTNARSPLNALRFIRNKWTITTGTLSVKKEDDTTEAWNAAVSTTPGADPVTGNDPA